MSTKPVAATAPTCAHGVEGAAWRVAADAPPLGNDVHVWRASVAEHAARETMLAELLDDTEREQAARFHFATDRTRYVIAHAMLRTLLAAYTGIPPRALAFETGAYGKPALDIAGGAPPVAFNMSHSADVVVVAVGAGRAIGVDVERWVPDIEAETLARDFFSPAERAMLGGLPPLERVAAFFTFWSRKEAYIKATAFGVSRGLDHFDVGLEREASSITDRLADDASERWSMRDLGFEPGYSGAVVAEGHDWRLLRFIWRLGGS